MKVIFSPKCLEYDMPGHPESSERVRRTHEFLRNFNVFEFLEPQPCDRQDLLLAHSPKLIDEIKHDRFHNPETPALPNIYDYAKLSAGGALLAMELALKGEKAFSLMRPPGHHAGKAKFEGFCYFNNIAIAAAKALGKNKKTKIAIIDIDVHHCNGTQDIFLGRRNVIVVSLHQYGDSFYPGTGKHSEANCYNYPLEAATEETLYLDRLGAALETIESFRPDLIAVSAGFDTLDGDPVGGLRLNVGTYSKIAGMIADLNKPRFAVLEGGYSEKLPECVYAFLKNF
jgi:acetoin utilization deacetylase AcuC-like enzyme